MYSVLYTHQLYVRVLCGDKGATHGLPAHGLCNVIFLILADFEFYSPFTLSWPHYSH